MNIAKAGFFSSDRTIAEYDRDIWHLGPVKNFPSVSRSFSLKNLLYHFIRQVFFFKIKWLLFAIYQINISFNFDLTPYIEGE